MIREVVLRARNTWITRERGKAQLFAHHEVVVNVRRLRTNVAIETMHVSHGIAKACDSQHVWSNEMKDIARRVAHDEFNCETVTL